MTPHSIALLAKYNQWINARRYDACERLDPAELCADKGAFFGSILATLNHIAVADTLWLRRFVQQVASSQILTDIERFPNPTSLRDTVATELGELRSYRHGLDEVIMRWVAELDAEKLAASLRYTNTAGVAHCKCLGDLLLHFFNHQTHHRGQVTTLLFQSGVDVGVTDLVTLIPDSDA